jgi:hypothetical protein
MSHTDSPSPVITPEVRAFAAAMGRKGGTAGRGAVKRRPKEHYDRMVKIRAQKKAKSEKQA